MTTCGRCLTLPIVVDRILPSQRLTTKLNGPQRTLRAEVSALGPHRPALRADNSGPQALLEHGIKDNKHAGDRQPSVTAAYVDLPHNCSQLLISQSDSWARLLSSLVDEVMDGRETIARDSVSWTHCQICCICGPIFLLDILDILSAKNNVTTNDKVYSKIMLWNAFIAGTLESNHCFCLLYNRKWRLLIVIKIRTRRAKSEGKKQSKECLFKLLGSNNWNPHLIAW